MGRKWTFYIGLYCIFLLFIWTGKTQAFPDGKVDEEVPQENAEPYNPETDLEKVPLETEPNTENKEPNTAELEHQNTEDTETQNVEAELVKTEDTEKHVVDMEHQNTDTEPPVDDSGSVNVVVNVGPSAEEEKRSDTVDEEGNFDPYEELDMQLQTRMSKIKSAKEFCELLDVGCEVVEGQDEDDMQEGEKVLVAGDTSSVAMFDACNPRNQTVALPKDLDPEIAVWPTCTRALRCGGCCTSDVFSCEPTETRERFVKIFRTRRPYKGAQRFRFIDAKSVKIIEHVRCDAQCKVKPIHCNPLQEYQHRYCRCSCTNQEMRKTCQEYQIWDDNECACICPNRKTIFCPHPSRFSEHLCKCTFLQEVAGEIDFAQFLSNIGHNLVVGPNKETTAAPTTTTEPTTTTTTTESTTTVAATTTTENPCKNVKCPFGNWKAQWLAAANRCQCRPPMR